MTQTANVHYRVVAGGAETNGGGFDPSLTAGMLTDLTASSANTSAPVVASASYNFVAGDVGAYLYVAAGTNWVPGWYPIASVASNQATLTASVDATLGGAVLAGNGDRPLTAVGCATTASPTGGTFAIDYSGLTAPILSIVDLASSASTNVQTTLSTFTKVMVGNMLRLASATGSPVADSGGSRYLALKTFVDANNFTVDKTSGTYTLGVAKVGGATDHIKTYANGGAGTQPVLTSPFISGNIVIVKGAGTNDPAIASPDFSWDSPASSYWTLPNGSTSTGACKMIGINGRPGLKTSGLLFLSLSVWSFHNLKVWPSSATNGTNGIFSGGAFLENIKFDQNGLDVILAAITGARNCEATNTGSSTATSQYAFTNSNTELGGDFWGNWIHSVKGGGIKLLQACHASWNLIYDCKGTATAGIYMSDPSYGSTVQNNIVDAGAGDGIDIDQAALNKATVRNNNISNHTGSGKTGLKVLTGTAAVNDMIARRAIDYNNLYNNTADRSGISAGLHDTAVNPAFTNAATGDFSNATLVAGWPGVFPGGMSTGYICQGAVQQQSGGSSIQVRPTPRSSIYLTQEGSDYG